MDPAALVFYSRADCPLCEKGLEILRPLAARHRLRIQKIDIESDPELVRLHGERIPVVLLGGPGGEELGWGRLSERALEKKLRKLVT